MLRSRSDYAGDAVLRVKCGSRRLVVLTNHQVFKFPLVTSWVQFIRGVTENLEERYWWSADGSRKRNPKRKWDGFRAENLAEIFWADRFGLLVIMERVDTESRPLTYNQDYEALVARTLNFKFADDVKPENVGYTQGGRLVYCDYGYFGGTQDCYLGT